MHLEEVKDRDKQLIDDLCQVWEKSVRATHLFLSEEEIQRIAVYIPRALLQVSRLIVATDTSGEPVAFMGISRSKLEMLFITPEQRGKSLGRQLVEYGIERYSIDEVCVNEQNPQAKGFYEHLGFQVYKRTDSDEQGNSYPLLYMKLLNADGMHVEQITTGKKRFLDLLLLGDEQEEMIDRYLERGQLFALYDDGLKAVGVVTDEGEGNYEIKNIAVDPKYQRKGYGKYLITYIWEHYQGKATVIWVGTGDVPGILNFYQNCGFVISHRIPEFFTQNYDHPMYEEGIQLVDMVYLKKEYLSKVSGENFK